MSDTTSPVTVSQNSADHDRIAEAALKRLTEPANQADDEELRFERERPIRQKFRRLVDPGIVRDNSEADAKRAFQILLKLADNLVANPDDPKFREFKSTNAAIQRALIEPKGAIEYAIEMGFRATVQDFQPKYVWHSSPGNLVALRVGRDVLREHTELAASKEERVNQGQQLAKVEKSAAVRNALLAFEDDRKRRKALDERMKATGYADVPPKKAPSVDITPTSPNLTTQTEGHILSGPLARRSFASEDDDTHVNDRDH